MKKKVLVLLMACGLLGSTTVHAFDLDGLGDLLENVGGLFSDSDDEEAEESKVEESKTEDDDIEIQGNMSKEFVKSMKSYEKFMDEYVEFMTTYDESSADAEILFKYLELMGKYEETVKSFEQWEDKDLTDDEWAYYLEVQTRVNQKLLDMQM